MISDTFLPPSQPPPFPSLPLSTTTQHRCAVMRKHKLESWCQQVVECCTRTHTRTHARTRTHHSRCVLSPSPSPRPSFPLKSWLQLPNRTLLRQSRLSEEKSQHPDWYQPLGGGKEPSRQRETQWKGKQPGGGECCIVCRLLP